MRYLPSVAIQSHIIENGAGSLADLSARGMPIVMLDHNERVLSMQSIMVEKVLLHCALALIRRKWEVMRQYDVPDSYDCSNRAFLHSVLTCRSRKFR